MTDRVHALTVVLGEDMREDDVQALIDAIRMMRNVIDVRAHVTDVMMHSVHARVRAETLHRIIDLFKP